MAIPCLPLGALVLLGALLHMSTLWGVEGYSMGAPDTACETMVPQHGQDLQTSPPPYTLTPNETSISGGQRISLTLAANDDFLVGFFVQGRPRDNAGPLGTFFTNQYNTFTCGRGLNVSFYHYLCFSI